MSRTLSGAALDSWIEKFFRTQVSSVILLGELSVHPIFDARMERTGRITEEETLRLEAFAKRRVPGANKIFVMPYYGGSDETGRFFLHIKFPNPVSAAVELAHVLRAQR